MEMVGLVLLGIATMAIIEGQKNAMERLVRLRREKAADPEPRRRS
jgi:hypothetical protein